jgi:rRNA maturation endonuclease Nob1
MLQPAVSNLFILPQLKIQINPKLTMICSKCHAVFDLPANFCPHCGASLKLGAYGYYSDRAECRLSPFCLILL